MHTNFDALAQYRMQEHEAYAAKRALQRLARETRAGRTGAAGVEDRPQWTAMARLAVPAIAAGAAAAFVLLIR